MLARTAKTRSPMLARMASENCSCSQLPHASLKRSQTPNARQHVSFPQTPRVEEACSSKLPLGSVLSNFPQGHAQTLPAVRSGDFGFATLCNDYLAQLLLLLLVGRSWVSSCSRSVATPKLFEYNERCVHSSVPRLLGDFLADLLCDIFSLGSWGPQRKDCTTNTCTQASPCRFRCGKTTAEIRWQKRSKCNPLVAILNFRLSPSP